MKEGYQQKLGAIKFEIGELLLKRDPVLAKKELEEAKEIFSNFGDGKYSQKIEILLQKLS